MKKDTIPLTVVVPTHGRTDLFLQTLESLKRQTLASFEIIVTDDSPKVEDRRLIQDATMKAQDMTGRPVSYLFSEPRLGQARNTNQGLRRARGEFVRILHSDDLLAPRALEAEVALLSDPRLNLHMLHHLVEPFRQAPMFAQQPALTLVQPSLFFRSVMHSGTPLPSATVFRRETMDAVGPMREDMDFLCDWEFCARLLIEQHRRNRFMGMLTPGFVGWRVHGDSTTGRLWDKHFLEHEQFMNDVRADAELSEALIGDQGTRDGFFATAVRYRYRRLAKDVANMPVSRVLPSLPRILRCALSKDSLRERLKPAPWTPRGGKLYQPLVVPAATPAAAPAAQHGSKVAPVRFVEPRTGLRFVLSAYVSAAIIKLGKLHAARHASAVAATMDVSAILSSNCGPALVDIGNRVEIRPWMHSQRVQPGNVLVLTEYNNTTNLWPLRGLMAHAKTFVLSGVNSNAFAEIVLHQCLKLVKVGCHVEATIQDNQHLTAFGFKSLLEKLFPSQFAWLEQGKRGANYHILHFRRRAAGHRAYTAPHNGWTFGMLTTGTRLPNVERFIDSIEAHCPEPYEILLVSPVDLGEIGRRRNVRVLRFIERDDLGWITRKKNLIASKAKYSDILICHDRFWLDAEFVQNFEDWGYAYGLGAVRVRLTDGSRGLDWAVVSSQNHVWSAGGLLDYRAYSQYAYNPGGATVVRKTFWRDFPWNENLFWNEHEDVELCRRVQRAGGVISLTGATLTAAEDRWVRENPRIPYCDQNEVLYGGPVGEQRILFLPRTNAA